MDVDAAVRRATEEALADVEPPPFREEVSAAVRDGSVLPGVLVIASARAVDPGASVADLERRAVGVQLVYEGLRLTRALAHDPPWIAGEEPHLEADLAVLIADVCVARATSLLADTEAAPTIVAVLRSFGRDQTGRDEADDPAEVDRRLEADVLELAAVAGTAAVAEEPDDAVAARVADLAESLPLEDGLPDAEAVLPPDLALPGPRRDDPGAVDAPTGGVPQSDS